MTQLSEKVSKEFRRDAEDLEGLRDDLKLQLHLMSMDMKSRWHDLEKKWEELRNETKLSAGTAARQLAAELTADYRKLKDELRDAL